MTQHEFFIASKIQFHWMPNVLKRTTGAEKMLPQREKKKIWIWEIQTYKNSQKIIFSCVKRKIWFWEFRTYISKILKKTYSREHICFCIYIRTNNNSKKNLNNIHSLKYSKGVGKSQLPTCCAIYPVMFSDSKNTYCVFHLFSELMIIISQHVCAFVVTNTNSHWNDG